jgi:Bacterial low temperature requirement A protein (LtrA)
MREFLNNYYMDDLIQRFFTFWILVLSVFYGNQLAYLAEDINGMKVWCISTYLVISGSFLMIEEAYSIFIPWLRKLVLIGCLIRIPGVGFWLAAIYLPGAKAVGAVFAAIIWEYLCPVLMDSPLAERFTPLEYRKALDVNHFQTRMANFFIIVLGEGVLQLVKDGPLGKGLTANVGIMSWVLVIYFGISFLYFVRDGSKTFIPAVRHKGWRFILFVGVHIPLFSALLTFVAGVMFILRHEYQANYNQAQDEEGLTHAEVASYTTNAVWTCAGSLAIVMLSMMTLALLDQPLDKPGTLRVDNRWIRLAPRATYIIVILCIPTIRHLDSQVFLGIASFMFTILMMWEWSACLERGGGFIEPRGLSLMMSHELKGKRHVAVSPGDEHDHNHPHRKFQFAGPLARS